MYVITAVVTVIGANAFIIPHIIVDTFDITIVSVVGERPMPLLDLWKLVAGV